MNSPLLKSIDFLELDIIQQKLQDIALIKITHYNCFNIYMKSKCLPFENSISTTALKMLMYQIESYYESNMIDENSMDPFVNKYKAMQISDIQTMLSIDENISIITKILTFKNWWKFNRRQNLKAEVHFILNDINNKAMYIHRKKIQFMRRIRDDIYEDLQHLQKN